MQRANQNIIPDNSSKTRDPNVFFIPPSAQAPPGGKLTIQDLYNWNWREMNAMIKVLIPVIAPEDIEPPPHVYTLPPSQRAEVIKAINVRVADLEQAEGRLWKNIYLIRHACDYLIAFAEGRETGPIPIGSLSRSPSVQFGDLFKDGGEAATFEVTCASEMWPAFDAYLWVILDMEERLIGRTNEDYMGNLVPSVASWEKFWKEQAPYFSVVWDPRVDAHRLSVGADLFQNDANAMRSLRAKCHLATLPVGALNEAVLHRIFNFVDVTNRTAVLTLMHVSRVWRYVADYKKSLWRAPPLHGSQERFEAWVKRGAGKKVIVHLNFHDLTFRITPALPQMLQLLARRTSTIIVTPPRHDRGSPVPLYQAHKLLLSIEWPVLRNAQLGFGPLASIQLDEQSPAFLMPSLKILRLTSSYITFGVPDGPWANLRELELGKIQISAADLITVLGQSPRLQKLVLNQLSIHDFDAAVESGSLAELPQIRMDALEKIEVADVENDVLAVLNQCVHFPVYHMLEVMDTQPRSEPYGLIYPGLTSLLFRGSSDMIIHHLQTMTHWNYVDYFSSLPEIVCRVTTPWRSPMEPSQWRERAERAQQQVPGLRIIPGPVAVNMAIFGHWEQNLVFPVWSNRVMGVQGLENGMPVA